MSESNSRLVTRQGNSLGSSTDPSFDLMFKVLVVGNAGVGKTACIFRYCENTFISGYVSTVGIDFKVKTVVVQDKKVKLQIWDTAGQERFRSITHAYYRGAMGFLLMFDITNNDSFVSVREWAIQIKELSGNMVNIILVGNKKDLEDSRVVTSEQASQLASQLGFPYIETSAKSGVNIKESFEMLTSLICQQMSEITEDTLPPGVDPESVYRERSPEASKSCFC